LSSASRSARLSEHTDLLVGSTLLHIYSRRGIRRWSAPGYRAEAVLVTGGSGVVGELAHLLGAASSRQRKCRQGMTLAVINAKAEIKLIRLRMPVCVFGL